MSISWWREEAAGLHWSRSHAGAAAPSESVGRLVSALSAEGPARVVFQPNTDFTMLVLVRFPDG